MAEDALHNTVRRFYRDGIPCRRFLNDDRGFFMFGGEDMDDGHSIRRNDGQDDTACGIGVLLLCDHAQNRCFRQRLL